MAKRREKPPVDHIGRYRELLSEIEAAALEEALKNPPPTALRLNPLKSDPRQLADNLREDKGWNLQPISFCQDGYTLQKPTIPPGRTLESRLGYFYIQDAASMLPVELFKSGNVSKPLILDLTAAPGGKTTHLASRFQDKGLIIANDGTASRIQALSSTLKTWGAVNSAVTNIPGEKFGQWFPDTFDYVLLDAPCSMENLHPGNRNKREIRSAERGRLAGRQTQLLLSALQACKPGGQVVYSTCTLAPEEDEGVLDVVLKRASGSVSLEDAGRRLNLDAPGLVKAFEQVYAPETAHALRLWPHLLGTSGFFSAHLLKNSPLPGQTNHMDSRPGYSTTLQSISPSEQTKLSAMLSSLYGMDLALIMEEYDLRLAFFRQSVYIHPRQVELAFPGLPVSSSGLRLGDFTESGFEISLECATRFSAKIKNNRYELNADQASRWARGEDIPNGDDQTWEKGINPIITDSHQRIIGVGRFTSRGIKNLLPRHLALKS